VKKSIILILFLGLTIYAKNQNIEITQQLKLQNQTNEYKIKLQNQKIEALTDKINTTNSYYDLRKSVLDQQSKSINWWWSVIAIFLTIFAIIVPIAAYIFNKRYIDDVKNQIEEFKKKNEEAKKILENIKSHEKSAKDITEQLDKEIKQRIGDPEQLVTKETIKEVEEKGSKLDKMIIEARELQADKKLDDAISKWHEILGIATHTKNKEQEASAYFNLGYLFTGLGDKENLKRAIDAYKKAIEIKEDDHKAYNNMGVVYEKLGGKENLKRAVEAYKKAIKIEKDDHVAYNNMGIVYGSLGGEENLNKAIEAYKKAIEIKKDDHEAYNNMGVAYTNLGGKENLNKAVEAYKKSIEIKPDFKLAQNNLKNIYKKLNT
jgi:tetratricopeptide (TPR) repeat protein